MERGVQIHGVDLNLFSRKGDQRGVDDFCNNNSFDLDHPSSVVRSSLHNIQERALMIA